MGWHFINLLHPFFDFQNVADIKKLKSVGICTIKGIQMTTRRALCNVKGLSEAKVDKIKEASNKLIVRDLSCFNLRAPCDWLQSFSFMNARNYCGNS